MKQLIITAHPSSKGFTHRIARRFKGASEQGGNEVEVMDLYDVKYKQDFLSFEEMSDLTGEDPVRDIIHGKLTWADEYIFVFPIWWSFFPAILKNFLDTNFSSGFAFQYGKGGKVHKLLAGKKAKIFATSDGPGFFYKIFVFPVYLRGYFALNMLGFCGVKVTSFTLFDKMRAKRQDDAREKMLQKVDRIASK